MRIESYRDLLVWKKAIDFVTEACLAPRSSPRAEMSQFAGQTWRGA